MNPLDSSHQPWRRTPGLARGWVWQSRSHCREGPAGSPGRRWCRLKSEPRLWRAGQEGGSELPSGEKAKLDLVMNGMWELMVILDNLEEQLGRKRMNANYKGLARRFGACYCRVQLYKCCLHICPLPSKCPPQPHRVGVAIGEVHPGFQNIPPKYLSSRLFLILIILKVQSLLEISHSHFSLNEFIHLSLRVLEGLEFTTLLGISGWGTRVKVYSTSQLDKDE